MKKGIIKKIETYDKQKEKSNNKIKTYNNQQTE